MEPKSKSELSMMKFMYFDEKRNAIVLYFMLVSLTKQIKLTNNVFFFKFIKVKNR